MILPGPEAFGSLYSHEKKPRVPATDSVAEDLSYKKQEQLIAGRASQRVDEGAAARRVVPHLKRGVEVENRCAATPPLAP